MDARQGKILNEYITQVNDNLLKKIQASGTIIGDDNWNNYLSAGIYKVQNFNDTAIGAPIGMYRYGILDVLVSETSGERRTMHIYYPHHATDGKIMAVRMYNKNDIEANYWRPWYAVQGTLL